MTTMTITKKPNIFSQLKGGNSEYEKTIGMQKYKVREGVVSVELLRLEPVDAPNRRGNPRLLHIHLQMLQQKPDCGPMTEEQQMQFFQTGTISGFSITDRVTPRDFKLLQDGLDESGEPKDSIIIQADGTVLEGNRRTVHCKLKFAEDAESKFGKVRVICYQPEVPRRDILLALAQEGVLQKAPWESQNKIAVLQELRDVHKLTTEQIAKRIGMSTRTAQVYLQAGDLLKEYQTKTKDLRPDKFTMFYKVATNPTLRRMMKEADSDDYDDELWDNFCNLVKDDCIKDCRHVAELTSAEVNVLDHPNGLDWLREVGSEQTIARVKKARAQKNGQPGIPQLKEAIASLESIRPTQRQQLASDREYTNELNDLLVKLETLVDGLKKVTADEKDLDVRTTVS